MIIFGINENAHDAALTVLRNNDILFAAHAERYSKIKNDSYLNDKIVEAALTYGFPDKVAFFENTFQKNLRAIIKGGRLTVPKSLKRYFRGVSVVSFPHHYSHAAGGYFTSNFNRAAIVVIDSIGEWSTASIWKATDRNLKQLYRINYPVSFGLFYSAFTKLLGYVPNKEEYIVMGLAAYGNPDRFYKKVSEYFPDIHAQRYNFHYGIDDWIVKAEDRADVAAAVQRVFEDRLIQIMKLARQLTGETNLVYTGGCALNCKANTRLWEIFNDIWIMPNPGDAGSSLGAAAALTHDFLNWNEPYLGYDIKGSYPIDAMLEDLQNRGYTAVASGRAEFGPRSLGNRSILADPRNIAVRDFLNITKHREYFRPLAPVIMEEHASEYFNMQFTSPYMQYAVHCNKPDTIPGAVHIDGTSRVQTVNASQHSGLYSLLKKWKEVSGVPVLINTSLNIKNQPLLNDESDVATFLDTHKYTIHGCNHNR